MAQLIIVGNLGKITQKEPSEKRVHQKSMDSCIDTLLRACSWLLSSMFKFRVILFAKSFSPAIWSMIALSHSPSTFSLGKVSTIKSKRLSTKRCSNVTVLICTAEADRVQSMVRTLV